MFEAEKMTLEEKVLGLLYEHKEFCVVSSEKYARKEDCYMFHSFYEHEAYAVHWSFRDSAVDSEFSIMRDLRKWIDDWQFRVHGDWAARFEFSKLPVIMCREKRGVVDFAKYLTKSFEKYVEFVSTIHAFTSLGNQENARQWQCTEKQQEKRLQRLVLGSIGHGRREVPTEYGNIDILTRNALVELKHTSKWKEAVGQVIVYGMDYPEHHKHIVLFGEHKPSRWGAIESCCNKAGITIEFLRDTGFDYSQEDLLYRGWLVEQGESFS